MLLSDALFHLILLNDLAILARIVPIPLVTLCLPAELYLLEHLISSDVFAGVFGSELAWPLDACFRIVSHSAAIGASSFTKLGYRCSERGPLRRANKATSMVSIDGLLFASFLLTLMVEHLVGLVDGIGTATLLVHVPGGVLDELGHVLQVDLLHTGFA